jgi:diguanylate cyclase (GGDEF)-like protein
MNEIQKIALHTKKFNVLCAEDDIKCQLETKGLLELFFNNVYLATNGEEALELYNRYIDDIDIVFADVTMPILSGFDLVKEIRAINPLEYIVITSANQDLDTFRKSLELGINDILIKPIMTTKLIDILHKAITYINYIKNTETNSHTDNIHLSNSNKDIFIDRLTNLENKNKLDTYLQSNNSYHLILVNIDNFDLINCKYGYKVGDEVIVKISEILNSIKSENSKLFRVISDEFAFLFSQLTENELVGFISTIIQTIENTKIVTNIDDFVLSCTVGIGHGRGDDILRKAHIAIKETRQIGKDKYGFYSSNSLFIHKRDDNLKWLGKIKNILKNNAIIPYYQPIVNNKTGKTETFEALARMLEINRVNKPYYYLETAKLFQLLPDITKVMISKVFENLKSNDLNIAINITQEDLVDNSFISFVLHCSSKYNIKTSHIIFEIIETITTIEDDNIIKNISLLNNLGFKIAIDDFGTNHLNMQKLQTIKIDYIKIDGYYIENLLTDTKIQNIVESMIQFAKSIDAKVIAESVSSKEIYEKVKSMGIEYSQGYFIGKPTEFVT